jgi:hypothetical protein
MKELTPDNAYKQKKVDEDWKQKVKKEKEEVEKQKREEQKKERHKIPIPSREPDFRTLVATLATQAMVSLGLITTQEGVQPEVDLGQAKYTLDLLGVLEEKTRGNLTGEEKEFIQNTLHELRLAYAQIMETIDKE